MVGDFILFIQKWWKQNITCRHHYVERRNTAMAWDECEKCGRKKNYIRLLNIGIL